jgi:hypothetical protein
MMTRDRGTRHGYGRAAVTTILIATALGGCGGRDDPRNVQHAAAPSSPSRTPTASPTGPTKAVPFPFASDLRVIFESAPPKSATGARVYADFKYLLNAYYYAGQTQGQDHRYEDRLLGEERGVFINTLTPILAKHLAPWGTIRYFKTRVTGLYGRGAALETCVDETKFGTKDVRTGKPDPKSLPSAKKARYKMIAGMQRGGDGVWRLVSYQTDKLPDRAAEACQHR